MNINGPYDPFDLEQIELSADFAPQNFFSAYERLFFDLQEGNIALFIRADEAEESWQVVEPILEAWEKGLVPLLGAGVREALAGFAGPIVYVANAMTQPGETTGFAISDHLRALSDHVGPVVTDVLVYSGELPRELVARYATEGAAPVEVDRKEIERLGVRLREADLFSDHTGMIVRHNAERLGEEVCKAALVSL